MRHLLFLPLCLLMISPGSVRGDDAESFELLDGDRVVFIGNTFVERDQVYGYLETMLTACWPDRNVTFRNLGWSGDTVWGEARAGFDAPDEGFKRLVDQVRSNKPTVIVVGYGLNESIEGEAGLPRFREGFARLLDEIERTVARIVVLSPIPHAALGPPLPGVELQNRSLASYAQMMQTVARERGHRFIDLRAALAPHVDKPWIRRVTDNGIHLTEYGYWWLWQQTRREFGMRYGGPVKMIGRCEKVSIESFLAAQVEDFVETPDGWRFCMTRPWLPEPFDPTGSSTGGISSWFVVRYLTPGTYDMKIDGECVLASPLTIQPTTVTAVVWYDRGPEVRQAAELRRTIVEKNRLYFHRWRPQNETYLFGFRKHEQGQNAAEVPKFDPLVEELEAKIAKLRVPVKHTYELIRVKDPND